MSLAPLGNPSSLTRPRSSVESSNKVEDDLSGSSPRSRNDQTFSECKAVGGSSSGRRVTAHGGTSRRRSWRNWMELCRRGPAEHEVRRQRIEDLAEHGGRT